MSGNLATAEAGSTLYKASQAVVEDFALSGSPRAGAEHRADFLTAMRIVASYVALGDGPITSEEGGAIADIFWLSRTGSNDAFSTALADNPALVEQAIAYLEQVTALVAKGERFSGREVIEPDLVAKAAEQVLQAVLAFDGSAEPEVGRMSEVTARVRQATTAAMPPPVDHQQQVSIPDHSADQTAPAGDDVASVLVELDRLVGLASVKREVETLVNLAKVFGLRKRMNMPVPDMTFHLVFLGNPGTGKTTVARVIAKLYGKLGLLSKGQMVEVDRSGLVGGFIGQTAIKTQGVIASALGGVLFIDEAYALDGKDDRDFGKEAVATLIKAMEDYRDDLVVIAAGYTDQMHRFIEINPGLRSRMSRDIVFDDYTPDEMVAIFRGMAEQDGYVLPSDCDTTLLSYFQQLWDRRGANFANARDVRNRFQQVIEFQSNRLGRITSPTAEQLATITALDLRLGS